MKFDGPVKSRNVLFFVFPAKAGIQYYQVLIDSRLRGNDMIMDFLRDHQIYRITESFPKTEIYGLTNQLRRAAVSIPSNIAEGAARSSDKEFIHFLYIALGSLSETETQIVIAKELGYIVGNTHILENLLTIRKMLLGLIKYLKNK